MKESQVVIYDKWVNFDDSWRDLFLLALKRKANVIILDSLLPFQLQKVTDVLICIWRGENLMLDDYADFLTNMLDLRFVFIGYNIPKVRILEGMSIVIVDQKYFSSEDELINAVLGETV